MDLKDEQGDYRTEYPVTSIVGLIESFCLPEIKSSQQAELIALTQICQLAKGQIANIYADSFYAFDVAHEFRMLWKQGFLISPRLSIKHNLKNRLQNY